MAISYTDNLDSACSAIYRCLRKRNHIHDMENDIFRDNLKCRNTDSLLKLQYDSLKSAYHQTFVESRRLREEIFDK